MESTVPFCLTTELPTTYQKAYVLLEVVLTAKTLGLGPVLDCAIRPRNVKRSMLLGLTPQEGSMSIAITKTS